MKRWSVALLMLLVLCPWYVYAASCSSTSAMAGALGTNTATTAPVNTTGFTLFVAVTSAYIRVSYVTDSNGNVYQNAPIWGTNLSSVTIRYVSQPVTSTNTTFTAVGSTEGGLYPAITVLLCSGTLASYPLAANNGINLASSLTFQTGSVTPLETGDLIVAAAGVDATHLVLPATATINSGFSTPITNMTSGWPGSGLAVSTLIAPNTTAVNPQWTISAGSNWGGAIAVFRDSSASPPSGSGNRLNTLAGMPHVGSFSGDGGPATSASMYYSGQGVITSLGLFCFADVNNNRIRCINPTSHSITQYGVTFPPGYINSVAGNGTLGYVVNVAPLSAEMAHPVGLAIDASDCMYVADQQNAVIDKFCTTGNLTVVAGGGSGGTNDVSCYTSGASAPNAGYVDGVAATSALLDCPQGVAVDSSGNIFIADSSNYRVRVVNVGATTHTFNGVSIPAGQIKTIYGQGTAACLYTGVGPTSSVYGPLGLRVDGSGNVFTAAWGCNGVIELTTAGVPTPYAGNGTAGYSGDGGPAASAMLNSPYDVDLGSDGNMYITDSVNGTIRAVNMTTGIISTVAGAYNLYRSPGAYVCGESGGFGGDGGSADLAGLCLPIAVKYNAGRLYIGDLGNELYRYTSIAVFGSQVAAGVQVSAGVQVR